jgi:predicted hydrolase (HD superfamily)
VRPSKRVADLPVQSVLKRMKEKSFARTVDRSYIVKGAEEWGLSLAELVALVIKAQIPIAERLGLAGAPAPDLPDSPPPPEPPAG